MYHIKINVCLTIKKKKKAAATRLGKRISETTAGPLMEVGFLPACWFVLGWHQRRGLRGQLCP